MKIYCLNDSATGFGIYPEESDEQYEWLVYSYEFGNYEGYGEAVALGKDGLLYIYNLGHCSCYGPFDGWGTNRVGVTIEEYMNQDESVFDDSNEIRAKIRELMNL